jgi:hypothetical protein
MNIVPWIFRVEIAFNNSSLSKEPVRPQARRPVIFEPSASRCRARKFGVTINWLCRMSRGEKVARWWSVPTGKRRLASHRM